MSRKSNQQLAEEFRSLLTKGAKEEMGEELLVATKGWRARLWRAFAEIEDRIDPLGAIARRKARGEAGSDD
jgi:predicted metal-dependent peptidase